MKHLLFRLKLQHRVSPVCHPYIVPFALQLKMVSGGKTATGRTCVVISLEGGEVAVFVLSNTSHKAGRPVLFDHRGFCLPSISCFLVGVGMAYFGDSVLSAMFDRCLMSYLMDEKPHQFALCSFGLKRVKL